MKEAMYHIRGLQLVERSLASIIADESLQAQNECGWCSKPCEHSYCSYDCSLASHNDTKEQSITGN